MGTHVSNSEIMELFKEIGSIKSNETLSEAEIETEVEKIREVIVKKMSFLVYYHTKRYINLPNYEDLVQEGFMGVVKAVTNSSGKCSQTFLPTPTNGSGMVLKKQQVGSTWCIILIEAG